jgi:hypothetical protein
VLQDFGRSELRSVVRQHYQVIQNVVKVLNKV